MSLRKYLCWAGLFGVAGTAAAEGLPPLRVDPALLGAGTPAPKVEPAYVPPPAPPVTSEVPQRIEPAPQGEAAEPRRKQKPASPSSASAVRAAPADAAQQSPVAPVPGNDERRGPTPAQATQPPLVEERPALPPLYSAHVAAGQLPDPRLKPSAQLTPVPHDVKEPRPTFLSANHIQGRTDYEMVAEGDAELRKIGTVLDADKIIYWSLDDEVEATGHVRLQREKDVFAGPLLRMKVEESTGFFDHPNYTMPRTSKVMPGTMVGEYVGGTVEVPITGRGEAERIDFEGENVYHVRNGTYTTCAAGNQDWVAKAADMTLDYNREVAEGKEGTVVFKGVPILYSPWIDFSLDNQRKSGFLSPTFGSTNTSGAEVSIPWYWNIAPDMDATITPRVMQKRGVQWNVEVRDVYSKNPNPVSPHENQARFEYLPSDRLRGTDRYGYSVARAENFGHNVTGYLILNGVSDGTYFTDLTKPGALAPSTYLLNQGMLSYGESWWSASVLAQRYSVLQDPSLPPVGAIYSRLPQINVSASRYDLPLGGVFSFNGEAVDFSHPTDVVGWRNIAYPQLSLPIQNSFMQVTPKVGISAARYALSRQDASVPADQSRTVPIVSLDSSVTFERDADYFGRNVTQTLEPRLYYLYVPYRDQSKNPVFDTGRADFNFAQIFSENRYAGGDRIGDANQLTAAVTSRLIDPATGVEMVRGVVGQRYYFSDQKVTLPGEIARTSRTADFLAAVSGIVMPKTYIDTGWQYNPRDKLTERLTLAGRYQPEIGKVLNAGYRYTRDLLGQIDVSAQWPLGGGWHAVGRYNYSTKDKQLIQTLGGFEYDAGCWIARIVVQSVATQTQKATTSLFLQLELNGFSRIGSNPLDLLKRSVPGYNPVNLPPSLYN